LLYARTRLPLHDERNMALITTIIPTYNRARELRRAVRSVLNQTYPHLRVCIYDNASTDETAAVVAEMAKGDSRIVYHRHSENIGPTRNHFYGWQRVETPYFSFLADDDVLLPHFYEKAMEGFQKYPQAGFSSLATIIVYTRDKVGVLGCQGWQPGLYPPPLGLKKMLENWPPVWTGVLFRRDVGEPIGTLDPEVGQAMDIDYEYRIASQSPIAISLHPGALLVAHPGSATVAGVLDGIWPCWLNLVRKFRENPRIPPDISELAERVLTRRLQDILYVNCGWLSIMNGKCAQAQKSAEILLQELQEPRKARTLRWLVRIQRRFSPFGRLIASALAGRRKLRTIWSPALREQKRLYLAYERYLDFS